MATSTERGGTAALFHDQLDPNGRDLGSVRAVPGGSDLPLGGPSARRAYEGFRPPRDVHAPAGITGRREADHEPALGAVDGVAADVEREAGGEAA